MPTPKAVLAFNASPQPDLPRAVRHSVAAVARDRGIGEDDIANFLAALGEAVANAIEHANADTPVRIEIAFDDVAMTASVVDGGTGFVLGGNGDALPEHKSERGRGIPIMRRCCDAFEITSAPGAGTAVILRRNLRTVRKDVA